MFFNFKIICYPMGFPNVQDVENIEKIKEQNNIKNAYNLNFDNNLQTNIHGNSRSVYSNWFSMDKIHKIEKEAFPMFFEDSTGEILYKDSRNKIVEEFRNNPKNYLTIGDCRKLVNCDLNSLVRIFGFLKKWGIINYSVNAEPVEKELLREIKNLICKCGNSNEPLYFNDDHLVVCEECYAQGKYGEKGGEGFYKLSDGVIKFLWSKEEELKLLEGIEKFGDDWKAVSNFVGLSIERCILKFLKIDIPTIINTHLQNYKGSPFMSSSNPIMSVLSFLCSIVHPKVAAEASKWAVKKYTEKTEELVAVSLCSSIHKAQEVLNLEEKKLERLYGVMVEAEIKKLELKMKEFDTMNEEIKRERENLNKLRTEYKAEIEELKNKNNVDANN
ncbi:SWIRM domain protein [Spraguea lophii 42_110]|uniref:SWIRM domain protein n=1 Tax=Spraguea lophii (strain 42_110) TaxID=1358809 RepID=S7XU21_SPRLO|nr:SWIRM domain protein [Spraguea lophii 42_110]